MLGLPSETHSFGAPAPQNPVKPIAGTVPTMETPWVLVPDWDKLLDGDMSAGMKMVSRKSLDRDAFKRKLDYITVDAGSKVL